MRLRWRRALDGGHWLESPAGQIAAWKRRSARAFHFGSETHPRSKNAMSATEREDFRRGVSETLRRLRRRAFTGPVAVELLFSVSDPNPAEAHTLAKSYLDLLYPAKTDKAVARPTLRSAFCDDRQVEYLAVDYHLSSEPYVGITIRPMRDVLADLTLVQDLARDGDHADVHPLLDPDGDDDDDQDDDIVDHDWEALVRMGLDRRDVDAMRRVHLQRSQQRRLRMASRFLARVLLELPRLRRSGFSDPVERHLQRFYHDILLTRPIALELGTLPGPGEGATFDAGIRRSVEELRDRDVALRPLLAQLAVTVFVVRHENDRRDLDNLALRILPVVHQVLEPPALAPLLVDLSRVPEGHIREHFERRSRKRWPKKHVQRFEVVVLPPLDDREPAAVRLALGAAGVEERAFLKQVENAIERWAESVDD